jgi:hypothetical protein
MQKFKLIFIGTMLGIIVSIFVDKANYRPIVEKYTISITQDWEKTCNPRERAYYEHLIRTKL